MSTEDLEKTISTLKKEVERLSAAREIENLVNRYINELMACEYDSLPEFFALKTPGLRLEIGPSGVFEGPEGIKKMYVYAHNKYFHPPSPGGLAQEYNASPVIEVAGDGQTAKGLWYSPGINTGRDQDGKLVAEWFFEKRALDFVKEDGKWKFWHLHIYEIFCAPYECGWVDMPPRSSPRIPAEFKPDKTGTKDYPYSATSIPESRVPALDGDVATKL